MGQNTGIKVFLVIMALVITGSLAALTLNSLFGTPQTVLQERTGEDGKPIILPAVVKEATVQIRAIDQMSAAASPRQVGTPYYCWKNGDKGTLNDNALAGSATALTTLSGLNVGDEVECQSFNATFYSRGHKFVVAKPSQVEEIRVDLAASSLKIRIEEDSSPSTDVVGAVNVTIAQGSTGAVDKMTIDNNSTDAVWNFGGIAWDIELVDANTSSMSIDGLKTTSGGVERLKGRNDTFFSYLEEGKALKRSGTTNKPAEDSPVTYLFPGQKFTFDGVTFTMDGSFSGQERVTPCVLDKQKFVSVKAGTRNNILEGVENDAPTPTDVGVADICYAFFIRP